MNNIVLAPGNQINVTRSLINCISWDTIKTHMDSKCYKKLYDSNKDSKGLFCWAVSSKTLFNKISIEDIFLFSERSTGIFGYKANVILKYISKDLSSAIWDYKFNKPWEYMLFFKSVYKTIITKEKMRCVLNYKETYRFTMAYMLKPENTVKLQSII